MLVTWGINEIVTVHANKSATCSSEKLVVRDMKMGDRGHKTGLALTNRKFSF